MIWLWPALAQAASGEDVRLAIVLSSNRGSPGEEPLRYADQDAARVADLLHTIGGYARGDVWVVQDATTDELFAALTRVTVRAQEIVNAGGQTSLMLFYAGHAGTDGLHLSGEVLPLPDLKSAIRVVPAQDRIVVLDACHAGSIARSRGSSLVSVSDRPQGFVPPENEAWLTSSGPEERSFEVEDRRGALFTHFFLSGARGAADSDSDKRVTLGEIYSFVQVHTAAAAADLGQLQQPRWAGTLSSFALTDLGASPSGVRVVGPVQQPLLVVDESLGQVIAEIPKGPGASVALPQGSYQVLAESDGQTEIGRLQISDGWSLWDPREELNRTAAVRTRGGLVDPTPWALGAGYRFGLATVPGRLDTHALSLSLRRDLGRGHALEVGPSASWLPFGTDWWQGSSRSLELRVGYLREIAALPLGRSAGPLLVEPGLAASFGLAEQHTERAPHPTWGAWYGGKRSEANTRHPIFSLEAGSALDLRIGPSELSLWTALALAARQDGAGLTPSASARLMFWVPFR